MTSRVRNYTILLALFLAGLPVLANSEQPLSPLISSTVEDDYSEGTVEGVLPYRFADVRKHLSNLDDLCDIVNLHLNIKGCKTHKTHDQAMTIYVGRKAYQPPQDADPIYYRLDTLEQKDDYLHMRLGANEGPYGTENYVLDVVAQETAENVTTVRVAYAYEFGALARWTMETYLMTIGRNKIGFTQVDKNNGHKEYIKGMHGVAERNAMRYFLALHAYFDTLDVKDPTPRLKRWHQLTMLYRPQLYELSEEEYVANKLREINVN